MRSTQEIGVRLENVVPDLQQKIVRGTARTLPGLLPQPETIPPVSPGLIGLPVFFQSVFLKNVAEMCLILLMACCGQRELQFQACRLTLTRRR